MSWITSKLLTGLFGVSTVALSVLCLWLFITKAGVERDFAKYEAKVTDEKRQLQEKHMAALEKAQVNIERISKHDEQKRQVLVARTARAESATASLREQITHLNSRPAPEDAGAAAYAVEASAARELLGECSTRRTDVARKAEELRDQVVGLQDFALTVCKAGE